MSSNPGRPLPGPPPHSSVAGESLKAAPRLDAEALRTSYKRFVSFGRPHRQAFSSGIEFDEGLDGRQFKKLCQDSKLLGPTFRAPDADILFKKVKLGGENTLRFDQFLEALEAISNRKGLPLHAVAGKVSRAAPRTNNAAMPREVRLHDDKVNAYTGTQGQKAQAAYSGPALLSPLIQKRYRSKLSAGLERIRRDAAQGPGPLLTRTTSDRQHVRTRAFEPVATAAMAQEKAGRPLQRARGSSSSGGRERAEDRSGPLLRRRSDSEAQPATMPHTWNPSPAGPGATRPQAEEKGSRHDKTEAAAASGGAAANARHLVRSRSETDAHRRRSVAGGGFAAGMLLPIFEQPGDTEESNGVWAPPLAALDEEAEIPAHLQAAMRDMTAPHRPDGSGARLDKAPVSPSNKSVSAWGSSSSAVSPRAASVTSARSRRSLQSNASTHTNYRDYVETGQLRPALSRESVTAWTDQQPQPATVDSPRIVRQVTKAELAAEILRAPAVAAKLRQLQQVRHPELHSRVTRQQEDACWGRFQAYFAGRACPGGQGGQPAGTGDDATQAQILKQCLEDFVDEEAAMQSVFNCYCMFGLWRPGVDAHTSRELKLSLQSFTSLCRDCGLEVMPSFSLSAAHGAFNLLKSKGASTLTFRQFMEVMGSVSAHLGISLDALRLRVAKPKADERRPVAAPAEEAELVKSWMQGPRQLSSVRRSSARLHRQRHQHHQLSVGLVA